MKKILKVLVCGKPLGLLTIVAVAVSVSGGASAASCQAKAASMAKAKGAKVLSVRAAGGKCKIKLLVKPAKGPPKRKKFVVSK